MTLHFLVVGLEARRELEVGQLRERWTVRIPLGWAIGGMATAVAVYLAFNAGRTRSSRRTSPDPWLSHAPSARCRHEHQAAHIPAAASRSDRPDASDRMGEGVYTAPATSLRREATRLPPEPRALRHIRLLTT